MENRIKMRGGEGIKCFIDGGQSGCVLTAMDGRPLCKLIEYKKEADALFEEGIIAAFKGLTLDNKNKEARINILESDNYDMYKFILFGQAAVAVTDKVLAPYVYEASDCTIVHWKDLQRSIHKAFRERRPLGPTPQSVVNALKSMHPIVKELDFTHLVNFIQKRNRFAHPSVDSHDELEDLIEDMRAFEFKKDDPDAKLGAVLIDIVVDKAEVIASTQNKTYA